MKTPLTTRDCPGVQNPEPSDASPGVSWSLVTSGAVWSKRKSAELKSEV